MSENTHAVELPAELHDRFVATTGDDDETSLLVDLVRNHVELQESMAAVTGGATDTEAADAVPAAGDVLDTVPPIAHLIGFDLVELDHGRSELFFEAGAKHANPMGTLHGGVLCDVGDAAMGTALASTLAPDESFTTVELDAKFTKPVWDAELTATGEVVRRGQRTALVESTVTDAEGSLVAKLSSTCLILRGDEAVGR